ncbi:hypothetical protein [Weissella hellenica]|uniref:hypothetical protein n=1 Tax=Weissella hellenica TaxID=46256 RepID=UPI0038864424
MKLDDLLIALESNGFTIENVNTENEGGIFIDGEPLDFSANPFVEINDEISFEYDFNSYKAEISTTNVKLNDAKKSFENDVVKLKESTELDIDKPFKNIKTKNHIGNIQETAKIGEGVQAA